jgi:hypothetical protein
MFCVELGRYVLDVLVAVLLFCYVVVQDTSGVPGGVRALRDLDVGFPKLIKSLRVDVGRYAAVEDALLNGELLLVHSLFQCVVSFQLHVLRVLDLVEQISFHLLQVCDFLLFFDSFLFNFAKFHLEVGLGGV